MKVAAGRLFFEHVSARAHEVAPDLRRALIDAKGTWSSPLYLPRVAELWPENLCRSIRGGALLHRVIVPAP